MFNRKEILERIVRLAILDPELPWQILYEKSILKYAITKREVEQSVQKCIAEFSLPLKRVHVFINENGSLFKDKAFFDGINKTSNDPI